MRGVLLARPLRRWSPPCRTCSTTGRSRPDDRRLARLRGPRPLRRGRGPLGTAGILAAFNRAGVLSAADVHVALRLAQLGAEADERVALAAALAVRAPGSGTSTSTWRRSADTAADEDDELDLGALPWPDPDDWVARLANSRLVAVGEDGPADRPLRLIGTALYLDRYWRDERAVADGPPGPGRAAAARRRRGRAGRRVWPVSFPATPPANRAGRPPLPCSRRLCVIAGGPGSGKTTTVARIVALLDEQAGPLGRPPAPRRPGRTHRQGGRSLGGGRPRRSPAARRRRPRSGGASCRFGASTLHRLLGARPDSASRFRHHRHHRLPHDVIIVDETSMVALSLMARLIEAVRPDARLILVGDPEQLASVEAGAVLGDIVGPALEPACDDAGSAGTPGTAGAARRRRRPPRRTGRATRPDAGRPRRQRRGPAGQLSLSRVRWPTWPQPSGPGTATRPSRLLSSGDRSLRWVELDDAVDWSAAAASPRLEPSGPRPPPPAPPCSKRPSAAMAKPPSTPWPASGSCAPTATARRGEQLDPAHRGLAVGVAAGVRHGRAWYLGRPVMVTANDYGLRLFNGDTGVVRGPRGRRGDRRLPPGRRRWCRSARPGCRRSDTVFAMTVHKAQGSEFQQVAVVLPPSTSAVLTRQLLYTAVTRARERLVLAGSEPAIRAAVCPADRPGLRA